MWPGQETAHGHERHNSNNLDCGRRRSAEIGLRGKCQRNVPGCVPPLSTRPPAPANAEPTTGTLACPATSLATGSGTNGGLNCAVHHRRGLRFDGEMQHEQKLMLLRSSGGEESGALQLEALSHPECDILRGPGLGQLEIRDDSFGSMVERRDFRAHRLPTRRDQLRYRGLRAPQPRSNCGAGVGGQNPATIAEFTLQRKANDFYDITLINGANLAERMAPIPAPVATPGAVSKPYWCKVPGSFVTPYAPRDCNWNFGKYIKHVPYPSTTSTTDYTALLLHSSKQCFSTSECQTGYTCSGSPGACIKNLRERQRLRRYRPAALPVRWERSKLLSMQCGERLHWPRLLRHAIYTGSRAQPDLSPGVRRIRRLVDDRRLLRQPE